MATLVTKTVTNNTLLDQCYIDYSGATIKVLPGETKTYQETSSNAGNADDNIPANDRYIKLKTAAGLWAYVAPNSTRNGVKVTPTEPA